MSPEHRVYYNSEDEECKSLLTIPAVAYSREGDVGDVNS